MSELVSVIIPIYNVESYLERCVDSILSQTYRNLEVILVDDGSTDCCGEMCDCFAEKDDRIRVIHKKNGGLSDARNVALDICTGEYISFVDSDDYVSSDFIETLYHAIQKHKTKLAICGIMKFDGFGKFTVDYAPSNVEESVSGSKMAETVWRPAAWNKLYHRSLFQGIRYPVGKLYEDLFIYHDILAQVDSIAFTGKISYYYFDRQDSIMNKKYDIRNADLIEGLDLRIQKLREMKYDDLADQQLSFVFNETVKAFEKLDRAGDLEKRRLKEVKMICDRHFREMMSYSCFSARQKAKIALFRVFPAIYLHFCTAGL